MKVFELIKILNSFDKDSEILIYNDCSDSSYDISCIDIDESDDSESKPKVVIFI